MPRIRAFAEASQATIHFTERRRHASELAAQAVTAQHELIVAVGGDGTMNEIASVLSGGTAILGLVPCGSGDGLGRHLGIHGSVERALEILTTGRPHRIDTGMANGHPFFTAAGIGFEAEIAQRFNRLARRGFVRYLSTSAKAFRAWQPETYRITDAGGVASVCAFTLAVTNANQYGNNAFISPTAQVDDGLLDLCAVPPVRFWNAMPLAINLFRGTIGRTQGVDIRRAARFIVERPTPGLLHTDGELVETGTRIEFSVHPASLRIMIPANSRPAPANAANARQ